MIKNGSNVKVHFTGKLADGTIFDSSLERNPLEFQIGAGQVIEGFESGLMGKKVGDKFEVTIPVDKAYGEVREDLIINVPNENVPEGVQVGQSLQANVNGNLVDFKVENVSETQTTLNANHPLSGKSLIFEIEVIDYN